MFTLHPRTPLKFLNEAIGESTGLSYTRIDGLSIYSVVFLVQSYRVLLRGQARYTQESTVTQLHTKTKS